MNDTTNLALPFIMPSQAQKHVTHNEALQKLDALVQLAVLDQNLSSAPTNPSDGDRYIIPQSAEGEWSGNENSVASFETGAWRYYQPQMGWIAWISDENKLYVWNDASWESATGGSGPGYFTELGINTTSDQSNKLAVKSDAILFTHDDVTGGGGSVNHKLNKSDMSNTSSLLFQSDYVGHAEIGLVGDNDLKFKVSTDGSTWKDAIIIDHNDGAVSFPNSRIGDLDVYTYHLNSSANIDDWYSVFEWHMDGNYKVVSAILDITHRNTLRHHELRLLFEFSEISGAPLFTKMMMEAYGDALSDGDTFKLVGNNSAQTCTLYVTRNSGHYPVRYMSFRHHYYSKTSTIFTKVNSNVGSTEPSGDEDVLVSSI